MTDDAGGRLLSEPTPADATPAMSPPQMALHLMRAVRAAGVELVFGVPGGGPNLDVVGAAEAVGCRFVLTHGETAAAIMAGVVGELTGRPGVCVATRGPGAASAVNGVGQALLDRQPMILVTDCVPARDRPRVSHQRLDQTALLAPVSKRSLTYGPYDTALPAEAVAIALDGRPGPVHVDVDPTAALPHPSAALSPPTPRNSTDGLARIQAVLAGARRPAVVVGVGATASPLARRRAVRDALDRLVSGTDVPVLTTYKARGIVGDRTQHAAGLATGATIEAQLLERADLIVGVGLDPVELIPAPWPYTSGVVLVGAWPIDDSSFFGDRLFAEVVGDVAGLLDQVAIGATGWGSGTGARTRASALARLRSTSPARDKTVTPQDVVAIAREEAPPGTLATVDAGAHMLVAMPMWAVDEPHQLLISSGLATMGFALPAAIAAALVRPGRRVLCLTGDGGLGMALAELETLARLDLDVVVVVFDDAALSLIAIKQRTDGHGGHRAVRYAEIDFAAVAAGCGLHAERVHDVDGYRKAIRAAVRRPGPTLVDVAVDPSGYTAVLDAIRGSGAGSTRDIAATAGDR